MMNQLDLIEKRIREVLESSTLIMPWDDQDAVFVQRLCAALQVHFSQIKNREDFSFTQFKVILNPFTHQRLSSQPNIESILAEVIRTTGVEFGLQFPIPPSVTLVSRNSLAGDEIRVERLNGSITNEKTGSIPLDREVNLQVPEGEHGGNACLLLSNNKVIRIHQSVINIGRKSGNQVIINDLRISRHHAQIRKCDGSYILFDIGSSGGTYVNGERITQHNLRPGDVISLAGYALVFSQDDSEIINDPKTRATENKITPVTGQEI